MGYVRANKLHECRVRFADALLERATVFPFFRRDGGVERILIIDHDTQTARVIAPLRGELRVRLFGRPLLAHTALRTAPLLDAHEAEALGRLWHFDPWWLLDEPPFRSQPTTPLLKATNCVDRLGVERPMLAFRRDLMGANWLFHGKSDQATATGWKAAFLPEHPPEVPAAARLSDGYRWILDPFWERS